MRLYLDIETIPLQYTRPEAEEAWRAARAKHAKLDDLQVSRRVWETWRKRALTVEYSRIVCVAVARDDDDPATMADTDEAAVMEWLDGYMQTVPTGTLLVGHNVLGYDVPLLRARAIRWGWHELAHTLRQWEACKPWLRERARWPAYDTMLEWPQLRGQWPSLDRVCEYLGVDHDGWASGEDRGAQVLRWQIQGQYDRIAEACAEDVRAVREIYLRMEGVT